MDVVLRHDCEVVSVGDETSVRHRAKFHQNRSNDCGDIVI